MRSIPPLKLIAAIASTFALALPTLAEAASNVPISEVTLFPDGATITRAVHVVPGMTKVVVNGLPNNISEATLRAKGDDGVAIGQIIVTKNYGIESTDEREAELTKKIQALKDKEALLDVDAKSAVMVQHFLESLNNPGSTQRPAIADAKSLAATIDTVHRSAADAFDRIEKVALQKRELDKQVDALQSELNDLGKHSAKSRDVTIVIAAEKAGNVFLSYQNKQASWRPMYRATLNSSTGVMELVRMAMVKQLGGEDWKNIKLTLSTGRPSLSPDAIDPHSLEVTHYAPAPTVVGDLYSGRVSNVAAPSPVTVTGTNVFQHFPGASEIQGTYATQFSVPSVVNVPGDMTEISVELSSLSMPVKQQLRIVPHVSQIAVVTVEAARPEGVWPSGDVQLYRDGDYVGSTQWSSTNTDRLAFSFGRDDLVSVKVDRTNQQAGKGGLISSHLEKHVADTFTISSAHKMPVNVLVLESSPISNSQDVKVESKFLPQPTINNWQERRGVVGWESQLAANGQIKISTDYLVSYPKDGQTDNLP